MEEETTDSVEEEKENTEDVGDAEVVEILDHQQGPVYQNILKEAHEKYVRWLEEM